ncbi:MAG: hypothetical protein R2879_13430 [Saprospiraceae bacterium]
MLLFQNRQFRTDPYDDKIDLYHFNLTADTLYGYWKILLKMVIQMFEHPLFMMEWFFSKEEEQFME